MLQHATTTMRRAASAILAALLGCALLGFAAPTAFAEYNVAAPSKDYTAVDKVTVKGSPIAASRIPNGTYHITASTSSSMASMSDVTLTVRDGSMSVNFTLTPSYTAIYPGKPEEAASLSNDDGTEVSPSYVMGKLNSDGETRNFTMSISSLNAVLVYSAYNGNSKRNSGMWYGRNVCFNSSAEIDALVATSGGDDEPGKDEPGADDPGKDEPGTDDPGTDDPDKDDPGADKPGDGGGSGKADGNKPGASGNGSASRVPGKGEATADSSSPKADAAPAPDADAAKDGSSKADRSAKTFATLSGPFAAIAYAEDASAGDAPTKEADVLEGTAIDYQRLLYVLIAALVVAGFAIRILVYSRQRK